MKRCHELCSGQISGGFGSSAGLVWVVAGPGVRVRRGESILLTSTERR